MPGAPGLVDGVRGDHIAISPPYTISPSQVEETAAVIEESIREIGRELGY